MRNKWVHWSLNNRTIVNKITNLTLCIVMLSITIVGTLVYLQTSKILVKNSTSQVSQMMQQTTKYLNERFEFTLQQFNGIERDNTFQKVAISKGNSQYISDFLAVDEKFRKVREQNNAMIENIYFYRNDGNDFYEYSSIPDDKVDVTQSEWYKLAKSNDMKLSWTQTRSSDIFRGNADGKVFSMVKDVNNMAFTSFGVLVFDIKESFLRSSLKEIDLGEKSCVFIVDKHGNVMSKSSDIFQDTELKTVINGVAEDGDNDNALELKFDGTEFLVNYNTININGWKIVAAFPKSQLTKDANIVRDLVFYIVILSIFIFAIISIAMVSMVTSPITEFVKVMNNVKDGDLSLRFKHKTDDEIGILGDTFNNMLYNINLLMSQVKKERDMKTVAELEALQQQINSHFLYNTLDSIYWLSKGGDGENAAEMVSSLANFMRLGLNNGYEITTVANEIEHIKNYMTIQKFRFDDKLDYKINVDDEILEQNVLKLILQPLVENSIVHGISEGSGSGTVEITGEKRENCMVFQVSDNGKGMDTEKIYEQMLSKIEKENRGGYALSNVYNRLKMKYKDEAKIEFFSETGVGSRVVITLPLDFVDKENL